MKSLDEAIQHCLEVAERNRKEFYSCPFPSTECDGLSDCRCLKNGKEKGCLKCADEHRQLAEWLKELAERRKLPEIIFCKDCENWDTTWQNDSAPNYHYCPMIDGTYSGDFYCAEAERRTDATN